MWACSAAHWEEHFVVCESVGASWSGRRPRGRQARLFALVREHLSDVMELVPCEAGMQVTGWFINDLDDRAVAAAGAHAGLALAPLSSYWMGPGGRAGLHLGYAGVSEYALGQAVPKLARIIGLR